MPFDKKKYIINLIKNLQSPIPSYIQPAIATIDEGESDVGIERYKLSIYWVALYMVLHRLGSLTSRLQSAGYEESLSNKNSAT
ncbi:18970_t:CDS:2 [Funneliformis geosporum]|nr:18970_t:CDS:2 [Funneliformis geosporum]